MIEYLIKRADGGWFDFPVGSHPYQTTTIEFTEMENSSIEINNCIISFSYEDPGIQISFEGVMNEDLAKLIVEEIRINIEKVSLQSAISLRIS